MSQLVPEQSAPVEEQDRSVGIGFVSAYCAAYLGVFVALLTPVLVTLAIRVEQLDPSGKAQSLALVMGVGAFCALVANPFFGKLSDRTTSRFGMRRPWLAGGAMVGMAGLFIVATADNIAVVLLGWCVAQLAWNAVLAALLAVLPDQVPLRQRGRVSGLLGMGPVVALVIGALLTRIFAGSVLWMFMMPTVVGVASVAVLLVLLRDRVLAPGQRPPYSFREFLGSFWVNPLRHQDFGWAWLSRFLVFMGVATLTTYQVYYLIDHLGRSPGEIPQLMLISTLVLATAVVIGSNASGWLSDLAGRRKVFVLTSALVFGAGMLLLAFGESFPVFLVSIAIGGLGKGVYFAVDLALVADVLPNKDTDAAKDLGVFNIANAMPQSLAPAIAPIFLAIGGGGNYSALYLAAAVFVFLGAFAIQPVRGVR